MGIIDRDDSAHDGTGSYFSFTCTIPTLPFSSIFRAGFAYIGTELIGVTVGGLFRRVNQSY